MAIDYESGKSIIEDILKFLTTDNVDVNKVFWEPQLGGESLFISVTLQSGLPRHEVAMKIVDCLEKAQNSTGLKNWLIAFMRDGETVYHLESGIPRKLWLEFERQDGRI